MGEQDQMMQQFVAWVAEKTGSDPQTVAQQIQQMSQSQEGQAQLQQLVQQFQQEMSGQTGVFRKGGKVDCLVQRRKKIKCAQKGTSNIGEGNKKNTNTQGSEKVPDDVTVTKHRDGSETRTRTVNEGWESGDWGGWETTPGSTYREYRVHITPDGQRDSTMLRWDDPIQREALQGATNYLIAPRRLTPTDAQNPRKWPLINRIIGYLPSWRRIKPSEMGGFNGM